MAGEKYVAQYGDDDVRDAVNRAIADGWIIGSVAPNRKRGKSTELFALYEVGMPAAEFVRQAKAYPRRKVSGVDCLRWDLMQGYITLAPLGRQICLARLDSATD
jgi:hypothetical protein